MAALRRIGLAALVAASSAVSACGGTDTRPAGTTRPPATTAAGQHPPDAPSAVKTLAACTKGTCWVRVTVATLWVEPWYPRAVDRPAITSPANPQAWVASMTVAQKRWLQGRIETQALYGTAVTVTGHAGPNWVKVVVPSQPTPRDRRGYPGWVPAAQLTSTAPPARPTIAVVRSRTAWAWSGSDQQGVNGLHLLNLSFDTRLPVTRVGTHAVQVLLLGGRTVALRRQDVALHHQGTPWTATPGALVADARRFLGLAYLWGGTSGFGYDCSGLTYALYHAEGVTLPRDAAPQATVGSPVTRAGLRPADLVFFRPSSGGGIDHVGLYVGAGLMIDAPHTGAAVRLEPLASFAGFAGARRIASAG